MVDLGRPNHVRRPLTGSLQHGAMAEPSILTFTVRVMRMATILLAVPLAAASAARAQDIEPRAYANAPVGVNFLVGGYAYTQGSLPTDPSVPLTNAHLATHNA